MAIGRAPYTAAACWLAASAREHWSGRVPANPIRLAAAVGIIRLPLRHLWLGTDFPRSCRRRGRWNRRRLRNYPSAKCDRQLDQGGAAPADTHRTRSRRPQRQSFADRDIHDGRRTLGSFCFGSSPRQFEALGPGAQVGCVMHLLTRTGGACPAGGAGKSRSPFFRRSAWTRLNPARMLPRKSSNPPDFGRASCHAIGGVCCASSNATPAFATNAQGRTIHPNSISVFPLR